MWLILLGLHLVGLVGYSLLLRKSLVDHVDRLSLAVIMQTGIAIPMVFALFIAPPDWTAYDIRSGSIVVLTALLVVALHITNVKALQYLEASTYSVLFNLRILFTTILGIIFLSEHILPLQIVGGLLIFLAVLTVRQKGGEKLSAWGIRWGIASAIVISVLNLAEKDLIGHLGYLNYAIPVMILASIVLWAILLAQKRTIPLSVLTQPRMVQLMALRAVSAYGATLAFSAGALISVATYISSLSVVIIVVLGILLLGERDYLRQKLIATTLATAGLTAILLASLL